MEKILNTIESLLDKVQLACRTDVIRGLSLGELMGCLIDWPFRAASISCVFKPYHLRKIYLTGAQLQLSSGWICSATYSAIYVIIRNLLTTYICGWLRETKIYSKEHTNTFQIFYKLYVLNFNMALGSKGTAGVPQLIDPFEGIQIALMRCKENLPRISSFLENEPWIWLCSQVLAKLSAGVLTLPLRYVVTQLAVRSEEHQPTDLTVSVFCSFCHRDVYTKVVLSAAYQLVQAALSVFFGGLFYRIFCPLLPIIEGCWLKTCDESMAIYSQKKDSEFRNKVYLSDIMGNRDDASSQMKKYNQLIVRFHKKFFHSLPFKRLLISLASIMMLEVLNRVAALFVNINITAAMIEAGKPPLGMRQSFLNICNWIPMQCFWTSLSQATSRVGIVLPYQVDQ